MQLLAVIFLIVALISLVGRFVLAPGPMSVAALWVFFIFLILSILAFLLGFYRRPPKV